MNRGLRIAAAVGLLILVSACASQIDAGVAKETGTPGFLWGLWHGFVFPFAWIGSLFDPDIAVYAVPNNGGWYDFGFFLGITVLGGGSWFSSKRKKD
jgi:LPXTG-motif cell wall-anchored protein